MWKYVAHPKRFLPPSSSWSREGMYLTQQQEQDVKARGVQAANILPRRLPSWSLFLISKWGGNLTSSKSPEPLSNDS